MTESRGPGTGDRGQAAGDRPQETGRRRQAAGDRPQETGVRRQGSGIRGPTAVLMHFAKLASAHWPVTMRPADCI